MREQQQLGGRGFCKACGGISGTSRTSKPYHVCCLPCGRELTGSGGAVTAHCVDGIVLRVTPKGGMIGGYGNRNDMRSTWAGIVDRVRYTATTVAVLDCLRLKRSGRAHIPLSLLCHPSSGG